jgi:molybdate transport system substrate-binding protein
VLLAVLLALGLAPAVGGCATSSAADPSASGAGQVTVFAAASLTEVFTDLGRRLEEQQPGLRVRFNFAGSSSLALQVTQGAPADVFASADEAQMRTVTRAGLASGDAAVFAANALEIAVPPGNPGRVTGLASFADPHRKTAICAPAVPCGTAARQVLAAAGVAAAPATEEPDVKAALTKVRLGEVDAALVYATDVRAASGSVVGIPFPEAGAAVNAYPLCVLRDARNPRGAQAFVDLVRSDTARQVLAAAGFRPPAA